MNKQEFVSEIVNYAMGTAYKDPKLNAPKRAKYYRQAGLELIAMAAEMDVELRLGV